MSAPEPNRAAQPAEAAILHEVLDFARDELSRLQKHLQRAETLAHDAKQRLLAAQEAFESADGMVARITAQVSATQERVNVAVGLLHPLRRAPDEIIQEIQLWWLRLTAFTDIEADENPDPSADLVPFVASSVSRSWRRVALASRELWNHPTIQLDLPSRTANAVDVDKAWKTRVSIHLERAASYQGLALRLVGHTLLTPSWIVPHAKRLIRSARSIHLLNCGRVEVGDALHVLMTNSHTGPLREITLHSTNLNPSEQSTAVIFPSARCIESLEVHDWDLEWSDDSWNKNRDFSHLTSLKLFNVAIRYGSRSLNVLSSSAPKLKELWIRGWSISGDDELTLPTVIFPHLKTFHVFALISSGVAEWLRLPVVRTVDIDWWGDEAKEEDEDEFGLDHVASIVTDNPTLVKLVLYWPTLDQNAVVALQRLASLEEIDISSPYRWDGEECQDDVHSFFLALSQPVWLLPKLRSIVVRALRDGSSVNAEEALGLTGELIIEMITARNRAHRDGTGPSVKISSAALSYHPQTQSPSKVFIARIVRAALAA